MPPLVINDYIDRSVAMYLSYLVCQALVILIQGNDFVRSK